MAKPPVRITLVAVLAVLLPIGAILVLPPWHNKASSRVHHWLWNEAGVQFHSLQHYTGTVRNWDSHGRLRVQYELTDGLRHGPWIEYDEAGMVKLECEYREGEPWEGVCQIFDGKAFLGQYKGGQPWNGCLPTFDTTKGESVWKCYIDGVTVPEHEYKQRNGLDPNDDLVGLQHWENSPTSPPADSEPNAQSP